MPGDTEDEPEDEDLDDFIGTVLAVDRTLEETFLAKVGSTEDVRANLSWLDEGDAGPSG